jgi:hypothetical protein
LTTINLKLKKFEIVTAENEESMTLIVTWSQERGILSHQKTTTNKVDAHFSGQKSEFPR